MQKINETFICLGCGKTVPLAHKTCRNHCPYCFASQHVDGDIPWDRKWQESCGGAMYPTMYEIKNGMTKILFVCVACWKKHRNKASDDDELKHIDASIEIYKEKCKNGMSDVFSSNSIEKSNWK